jgi:hypothetical protein
LDEPPSFAVQAKADFLLSSALLERLSAGSLTEQFDQTEFRKHKRKNPTRSPKCYPVKGI